MGLNRWQAHLARERAARGELPPPSTPSSSSLNIAPSRSTPPLATQSARATPSGPTSPASTATRPRPLSLRWRAGDLPASFSRGQQGEGDEQPPLPPQLVAAQQAYALTAMRWADSRELVLRYAAIHPSQYAPVTTVSKAIPARDRVLHACPPPGCPRWRREVVLPASLRLRTLVVRAEGPGLDKLRRMGYALKCFHTWACNNDIPDSARMPLRWEVLEAYLASLAGFFSKALIRGWIAELKRWHSYCGEFTVPSHSLFSPSRHVTSANLSVVSFPGSVASLSLHLPFDKVQLARGADVSITPLPGSPACPVTALQRHLRQNAVQGDEHLFSFTAGRGPRAGERSSMTKQAWRSRLAELVAAAGLPEMFSGHSIRIGGATQLLLDGVDPLVVKVVGRWKSDAFELYWRNVTAVLARHVTGKSSARAPIVSVPVDLADELRGMLME